jgi:enamine deaminase RidA (YjgF/YER057c/UK114 family)
MMKLDRRRVLSHGACLAAGAGLGWLGARFGLPGLPETGAAQEADTPEHRLKKLGLELPPLPKARVTLAAAVQTGGLIFLSGHIATDKAGKPIVGKVGKDLTLAQGQEAARRAGQTILAVLRAQLGSLNRVGQLVKSLGMVNCAPDFTQQPQVIDAYSQLMIDVFGEKVGRGARSAIGVGSLPLGVAVEIECIVSVARP